jgi:hypothetical protein
MGARVIKRGGGGNSLLRICLILSAALMANRTLYPLGEKVVVSSVINLFVTVKFFSRLYSDPHAHDGLVGNIIAGWLRTNSGI